MQKYIEIFKKNLESTLNGGCFSFHVEKGNNTKHRNKKFRDGTCSLCVYGTHEPQSIDENPVFKLVSNDRQSLRIRGNDGVQVIKELKNFFGINQGENIKIDLFCSFIKTRFHKIQLVNCRIPIVGFSEKSKELYIDVDGNELSILVDRLSRDAEICVVVMPSKISGFSTTFDWSIFDRKNTSVKRTSSVEITPWVHWSNIDQLEKYFEKNGIYIIGLFDNNPGFDMNLDKEIVYIGITAKRNFRKRLKEFYVCAMTNGTGHSGGCEFRRTCVDEKFKIYTEFPMPKNTYVRLVSTSFSYSKDVKKVIEDFESRLIFRYADLYGRIPLCNRKY